MKKEANLITSPVLREFYTTAVQKEWITEDKLSKSASTSIDKYAATGNFMQDLVNLASGLRELGLYEQAESLEVKLNIFKKAQLAFSNLIDEQSRALQQAAHAESAKIVDAQGGWGVIHTNMDRQQKILETLTHQPGTGSPAPVMNNLVVAAAEALGLLKFAQGGAAPAETDKEALVAGLGDATDSSEADKLWDLNATKEQKENAKQIETKISELKNTFETNASLIEKDIYSKISSFIPSKATQLFTNEKAVEKFAEMTNQDISAIRNFLNNYRKIGNDQPVTAEMIATQIVDKAGTADISEDYAKYQDVLEWSKQYNVEGSDFSSTYFKGSKITDTNTKDPDVMTALQNQRVRDSRYLENSNSVWLLDAGIVHGNWTGTEAEYTLGMDDHILNQAAVATAAEAISNKYNELYDKYFTKPLSVLKTQMTELLKNQIIDPYLQVNTAIQELPATVKSSAMGIVPVLNDASKTLTEIENKINKTLDKTHIVSLAKEFAKPTWDSLLAAVSGNSKIKETIKFILEHPLRSEDVSNIKEISIVITDLVKAARIYAKYIGTLDSKDPKRSASEDKQRQIINVISKLKDAYDKGGTLQQVRDSLGDESIRSFSSIQAEAAEVLRIAREFTGIQSDQGQINDGFLSRKASFNKLAGLGLGGTPGARSAPSGASPAKPGGVSRSTQPVDLSPAKQAVQHMQRALSFLADYLMMNSNTKSDASIIRTVGKSGGAITDFDGVWGVNTEKALKTAKKYVTSIKEVGPVKAFGGDDNKMKSAAEENYRFIAEYLAKFGVKLTGAPGGANLVFDKISDPLDYTGNVKQDGDVPVTRNDLVNLKNFFNFVRDKVSSFNWESATAKDWTDLLSWFWRRSNDKARTPPSVIEERRAKSYMEFVANLFRSFLQKMQNLGIDPKAGENQASKWNTLLLEDVLAEDGGLGGLGGQAGGLGAAPGSQSLGGAGMGPQGGPSTGIVEPAPGGAGARRVVPFDENNIYLDSVAPDGIPWFQVPGNMRPFRLPMNIVSGSPMNAALTYFAEYTWSERDTLHYFVNRRLVPNTVTYDQSTGNYIYTDNKGGRSSVTELPAYQSERKQISQLGALNAYSAFLESLIPQLRKAAAKAIQYINNQGKPETQTDRYINTLNYHLDEWVRAINRQYTQIGI